MILILLLGILIGYVVGTFIFVITLVIHDKLWINDLEKCPKA